MNLPPQFNSDDDNQLVPYLSEAQADSHSFPSEYGTQVHSALVTDCDLLNVYITA